MEYIEFRDKKYSLNKDRIKLITVEELRFLPEKIRSSEIKYPERAFLDFHRKHTCPDLDINYDDLFFDEIEILLAKLSDAFRYLISKDSVFAYKNIEGQDPKNVE